MAYITQLKQPKIQKSDITSAEHRRNVNVLPSNSTILLFIFVLVV